MSDGIIGKKLGMTRLFQSEGASVPVTVIEAGPVRVSQIKTKAKDGYDAVQVGYGQKRHPNKPELGHSKKTDYLGGYKLIREFKPDGPENFEGQVLSLNIFAPGEKISVTGTSKGRGFSGVMKRHGFGGGRATHGCLTPRGPGSIGCSSDPSRVFPGKRMAGHHGAAKTTVKNLSVVDVRPEYGVILVKGAVPGPNGGLLILRKAPKIAKS